MRRSGVRLPSAPPYKSTCPAKIPEKPGLTGFPNGHTPIPVLIILSRILTPADRDRSDVLSPQSARPGRLPPLTPGLSRQGAAEFLSGWPIADAASFLHHFETFLRSQQRRRFQCPQCSAGCRRNRKGCSAQVVRHPANQNDVIVAEAKPGPFNSSSKLFNGR